MYLPIATHKSLRGDEGKLESLLLSAVLHALNSERFAGS